MPITESVPFYEAAIIGAGFSGSLVAVQLAKEAGIRVALIERSGFFGAGLAYGMAAPEHLLNVPAGKMSAFPDEPGHFVNWLKGHPHICAEYGLSVGTIEDSAFLPRRLYGAYLEALVSETSNKNPELSLIHAEAVDIEQNHEGGYVVSFADGSSIQTSSVILAWGNYPPNAPVSTSDLREVFINNPWSQNARDALEKQGEILVIGSGLTCLDLLATALKVDRQNKIHVLSRHGRFPQSHLKTSPLGPFLNGFPLPRTIRALYRLVRSEVAKAASLGIDWRSVIDSLRSRTQEVWTGFSRCERRRFLRHVRPLWETLRHRAAPEMVRAKVNLDERGLLVRHCGRVERIDKIGDEVEVTFRSSGVTKKLRVAAVVNATGPESDPRRVASPLLRNLLARKLVRPDPLGLGVEVSSAPREDESPLHTLGSLRKGALWESTAVPELRVQAQELAQWLASRVQCLAGAGPNSFPTHDLLFEI